MIQTERPSADGRPTAVLVFNELRTDAGRLTHVWLARLRALDAAGWATHAALVNRDARLGATLAALVSDGRLPAATTVHHYPARDRRVRPSWRQPLAPGESLDPRIGDWLDWLTGRLPGSVVMADSPAAYPYLAHMTNPTVQRVAGIHLNHLTSTRAADPPTAPMTPRFAARFEPCHDAFDALVVMTHAQADDLRRRLGPDAPVAVIPPGVDPPAATPDDGEPTRLVTIGALDRASRHAHAIRAAAPALAADPALALDIVGEGGGGAELGALVDELGLTGRVVVRPDPADPYAPLDGARLVIATGRRDSCPLVVVRALARDVPVVAYDARYGPREILAGQLAGALVPDGDVEALTAAVTATLAARQPAGTVRAAAAEVLAGTDPGEVGRRWVELADRLSTQRWDPATPVVLVEAPGPTNRVLRLIGVLGGSAADLGRWRGVLPELVEPCAWVVPPTTARRDDRADGAVATAGPARGAVGRLRFNARALLGGGPAPGPTRSVRDVVVQVRTHHLALVATKRDEPVRVDLTDGRRTVPLLSTAFEPRLIASPEGRARLVRHDDGTVWAHPLPGLVGAADEDGRMLARLEPGGPASDVTHAIDWTLDIDWTALRATPQGATFTGTLTAPGIVPDTTPGLCVPDVGGNSRVVGHLELDGEPQVEGTTWTADVRGLLEVDPLVATTDLARRALSLHLGFRGLPVQLGAVCAPGGGTPGGGSTPFALGCPRGTVTLLRSRSGRILVAPGQGSRTRIPDAVLSALRRG